MGDVEQALREYIREHRAGGEADPRGFLERVEQRGDKLELEALIDAYLEHAPRANAVVTASPAAEAVVDRIEAELDRPAQTWRTLLPSLRMHARLKRSELVAHLAGALRVSGHEDKLARYYNAMEHEQLDPSAISPRVLDALAGVVQTTAEALRNAAPRPAPPGAASPAFARLAPWDADEDAVAASPARAPELEWDEVDELFRGG